MIGTTMKRDFLMDRLCLIALGLSFIMLQLLDPAAADSDDAPTVYAARFITSRNSQFGLGIEGTSVDYMGTAYATAFLGGTSNGLGTIATPDEKVSQEIYSIDQTGSISYNGLRFLPLSSELSKKFLSRAIATDVRGHQIVHILQSTRDGRVRLYSFCGNQTMAQPNDMAVAALSGRIYASGGRFGKLTTAVGDGDLWICATPSSFYNTSIDELQPVTAVRLGLFGNTNGVELSPDERTLYLSEEFSKDGFSVVNRIWKFAVDPSTGGVSNKTLFVDFGELDGTEWISIDGIRADIEGNLFVARNGPEGLVVKFSPEGKLLLRIKAEGLIEVTNMDLAGEDGTSLFIVGKCVDKKQDGCVDVWHGNSSPGRAWAQLRTSP